MGKLIFSMGLSLDGFTAGPGGDISWTVPDEELFRFHLEQTRELGGHICGRGLYETMRVWETDEARDPARPAHEREFAEVWDALPKYVCSRTLAAVAGSSTLLRGELEEEVRRLKLGGQAPLAVGGAVLAGQLMRLGLIDEYHLFIRPVLIGRGTRYFPSLEHVQDLELLETRRFAAGQVLYARYALA